MTIARKILIGVDKFFNWLSGGNIDNTISARVGYFAATTYPNPFWQLMESVINFAFWPIDGPDHCLQAMKKEKEQDDTNDFKQGPKFTMAVLAWFTIIGCSIIAPVIWVLGKLKEGR